MRVIDISRMISDSMAVWPGDPPVRLEPHLTLEHHSTRVSSLVLGTHTGTHVDPPAHFLAGGSTVDQMSLETLIGPAWVADLTLQTGLIDARRLSALAVPAGTERLLLCTGSRPLQDGEHHDFNPNFPAFSVDGAGWLVAQGVKLVGIDTFSIEPFDGDGTVHRLLLAAGIVIVEGLVLADVAPGWYILACLPLKIKQGDGAPARVVLMQNLTEDEPYPNARYA